ncbi:ABC transporter ATP-binding protein [Cryobacterium sp. Y50]|uniref:ABC transporter ATP-binding protein n=1 Tax=Cryobacterium sp. Y50 TaxID=2048286 RepID=UPI000CE4793C|nr:ABC transporter ATP-binding protein [Cryobacterium sp. Y50]
MPVIELEKVTKSFKGVPIFDNASATFEAGKIHGIVGPNGSGKSILFKMICGFILPDTGKVIIDSQYQSPSRTFPEQFGVIIDRPGYLPQKTGLDNLRDLAKIRGAIGDAEIRDAMEKVGLPPGLKQKARNYSLGMKQKLALAQAIMEDQKVLILDEPFNALDADSVDLVRNLLKKHREQGRTVIFTSHNREDIDLLADHTLRISNSKLERIS